MVTRQAHNLEVAGSIPAPAIMQTIRIIVGILDSYNRGKVVYIDFTYCDCIIVWVQYKAVCRAYRFK